MSGLVEAYIRVGIAKLKPIKTALYPNFSRCSAKIGYIKVTAPYTITYEIKPNENLGTLNSLNNVSY